MWKRRRESERKQGEEGRREGVLKEEENSGIEGDRSGGVYLGGGWGDRKERSEGGRTGKWRVRRGRLRRDRGRGCSTECSGCSLSLIQRHQLCPVCTCVQCLSHHI